MYYEFKDIFYKNRQLTTPIISKETFFFNLIVVIVVLNDIGINNNRSIHIHFDDSLKRQFD